MLSPRVRKPAPFARALRVFDRRLRLLYSFHPRAFFICLQPLLEGNCAPLAGCPVCRRWTQVSSIVDVALWCSYGWNGACTRPRWVRG
jgi:hypothetical protein